MQKECMNCGHINELEESTLGKCSLCDVFFHKFETNARKQADKKGITLEEYYLQLRIQFANQHSFKDKQKQLIEINREWKKNEIFEKQKIEEKVKAKVRANEQSRLIIEYIQESKSLSNFPISEVKKIINAVRSSTTDSIPDHLVKAVREVVASESVFDSSILKTNFTEDNEHNSGINKLFRRHRERAMDGVKLEAIRAKGNAVLDVKFEYLEVKSHFLVIASGTVVFIDKIGSTSSVQDPISEEMMIHDESSSCGPLVNNAADVAYIIAEEDADTDTLSESSGGSIYDLDL